MKFAKLTLLFAASAAVFTVASNAQSPWERPVLSEPNRVAMGGLWGAAYQRGLARIGGDPYTTKLVLADVNFGMKRWFTNYSGDISGRFLELASSSSSREQPQPGILREVMDKIPQCQKSDGHFGADIDWNRPVGVNRQLWEEKMMPILWGNGRLLLGLVAAYERFGDKRMLDSARRLGDFYVTVAVDRFCDPKLVAEYRQPSAYAGAYVTCVFEGMEGLVQLYRATHDERYLKVAERMAAFHEAFDTLPVDHSHGSLSEHEALLMLYEETGDAKLLKRVADRWNAAVKGGFIYPSGGVMEKFWVSGFDRDEGCSEADWLRVNLMLWQNTGETRYLDMAERTVWNELQANQFPAGGFGHRRLGCDGKGVYAYRLHDEESLWCCVFHGSLGLWKLKGFLATGTGQAIQYNFPVDYSAPVKTGKTEWKVTSKSLPPQNGIPVACEVLVSGAAGGTPVPLMVRIPEWADKVVIRSAGQDIPATRENGYLRTKVISGTPLEIAYYARPFLENRRMERVNLPDQLPATIDDVVIRHGPHVLMNSESADIQSITLAVGADGAIPLPGDTARKLIPWCQLKNPTEPHAFVFNARLEKQ